MDKGLPVMQTLYTELNLWSTQVMKHASEEIYFDFEEKGRCLEIQKRVISGTANKTYVLQKFKRNKTVQNLCFK